MKLLSNLLVAPALVATLLSPLSGAAQEKPGAKPAANAAEPVEIPRSVFVVPASPKEGRNPFFPNSTNPEQTRKAKPEETDASALVLNGITSPPKRMAMINGKTFETGETGEVRLQNGARLSIQCLEIRDKAAVVLVGSQKRELRLRGGI